MHYKEGNGTHIYQLHVLWDDYSKLRGKLYSYMGKCIMGKLQGITISSLEVYKVFEYVAPM